jgi:hypothetical protein
MKKRGQITVFVIIAIVIIAIIATIIILNNKSNIFNNKNSPEIANVNLYIQGCAEQRALDAVRLVGLQGGYVNLPKDYLKTNFSSVAYGYYEGKNTLPTKTTIEKEINYYIESTTQYCIDSVDFPEYNITLGKPSSSTKIEDNQVLVTLKLPATISKAKKTYSIEGPYEIQVPIRLGKIYSTAELIIDNEINNPDNIELSRLSSLDYNVTIVPVTNTQIIYIITEKKSQANNIPYSFLFANKF